jgi:hypothetical protein
MKRRERKGEERRGKERGAGGRSKEEEGEGKGRKREREKGREVSTGERMEEVGKNVPREESLKFEVATANKISCSL